MKMNMPQQSPFGGNGEATVGNEYLEFPSSVHVGDQLKDGGFTMNIKMGPMQGSVTISITQRKVVAQETITTTAGSWSCFKINSVNTVTRNMAGRDLQPIITETTEWYAPGVGIIKISEFQWLLTHYIYKIDFLISILMKMLKLSKYFIG